MGANLEYQYEIEEIIRIYLETRDKRILLAEHKTVLADMIEALVRKFVGDNR